MTRYLLRVWAAGSGIALYLVDNSRGASLLVIHTLGVFLVVIAGIDLWTEEK